MYGIFRAKGKAPNDWTTAPLPLNHASWGVWHVAGWVKPQRTALFQAVPTSQVNAFGERNEQMSLRTWYQLQQ